MRTIAFLTLTALLSFAAFGIALADTHHDWRHDSIRYQSLERGHWTTREVRRTIVAAVDRWPVPGGIDEALKVARCESSLDERASNDGNYLGLFQQSARYWPERQNLYDSARWNLRESPFNARAAAIVSIRMAHVRGWTSDWAGCA